MACDIDKIRYALNIQRGEPRDVLYIAALATLARRAVLSAKVSIIRSGLKDEQSVRLAWETLSSNLYVTEEYIAQRVLSILDNVGYFGHLGPGGVAPVSLDTKNDRATFLGRILDGRILSSTPIRFEPEHEEYARIVTRQANILSRFIDEMPRRNQGWKLVAFVAIAFVTIRTLR